jgi:hypothetical protein
MNGFKHAYFGLPDIDAHTVKNDLLVRGRVKSAGIEHGKGMLMPSVGLWGLDGKSRNVLMIPCVNFFPGTYDWRDFACVVEASRIRRYSRKVKGPITLTFRVNLCNQPGTVEVENVEVIPLEKTAE